MNQMNQIQMSNKDIAIRYTIAWISMIFLAIFNGITRGLVFEEYLDTLAAHQLSSVTLVLLFLAATWFYSSKWEIGSSRQALLIGLIWVILTPIFEFAFGIFVMGHPLENLLNDYNLLTGRVWSLVMLSIFLLPTVVYRIRSMRK